MVKFLILNFEGLDEAVVWDEEAQGLSLAFNTGCELDTAQYFSGVSSLLFPTGEVEVGYNLPHSVGNYTLGAELAPAIIEGNWSIGIGTGWVHPVVGGILDKGSEGVDSSAQQMVSNIENGAIYEVSVTVVNSPTTGTFVDGLQIMYLGTSANQIRLDEVGTFTATIVSEGTDGITFSTTAAGRFGISAISVKKVTVLSSDMTYTERFRFTGTPEWMYPLWIGVPGTPYNPEIYVFYEIEIGVWTIEVKDREGNYLVDEELTEPPVEDTWVTWKIEVHGRDVSFYIDNALYGTWTATIDNPMFGMSSWWTGNYTDVESSEFWLDQVEWTTPLSLITDLTFTGADHSQTITDESGRVWTVPGDAEIIGNRLSLNGTEYIQTAGSVTDSPVSDDFEISFDTELNADLPDVTAFQVIYQLTDVTITGWVLIFYRYDAVYGGTVAGLAELSSGAPTANVFMVSIDPILEGVEDSWRISRVGDDFKLFRNDIQQGATQTLAITFTSSTEDVKVGWGINGYLDNLRYLKGPYEIELNSTLEGISSDIRLKTDTAFNRIPVTFELVANAFDDIPVVCEWNKARWEQIPITFELYAPNYYNYENISAIFHVVVGTVFEDIPFIFSIARAAQDYASYIMQKTYSVTIELDDRTDLELSDWNVSPNKIWYVSVDGLEVTLYDTEADMLASENPVAYGEADPITYEVVLSYIDEYDGTTMEFYYQDFSYHLVLSDELASVHQFRVRPFTDLEELRHPIYNNSNIVLSRGEAELNLHTFTVLGRELVLGEHIPEMEPGEVVDLTSTRRNVAQKSQILSQTIEGSVGDDGTASLTNTIRIANYTELYRR
jgi:hypothetical protein